MSSAGEGLSRPLPEQVRSHVVDLASQVLGSMPAAAVPPPLRNIARFEPRKRARLGGTPIAAQLETDKEFREAVAEVLAASLPELVAGLAEGAVPPAAEPVMVAAAAYLTRPPGWVEMVETPAPTWSGRRPSRRAPRRSRRSPGCASSWPRRRRRPGRSPNGCASSSRPPARRSPTCATSCTPPGSGAGRPRRTPRRWRRPPRRPGPRPRRRAARGRASCAGCGSAWPTPSGSWRPPAGPAREGRSEEDTKVRVLLDALADAAAGLRRELALPSGINRPADSVASVAPGRPGVRAVPARALADDDPALLDQLLALPQIHLIVDGYNVTKTGYGTLTLADQRNRLLTGLGALYAQTRTELTCVFDGAELDGPVPVSAPRGVRVLFSAPGQIADDLIRQLVRAEPVGRALAVVSSDREVAESVRRMGARPVPAALLLKRLGRG